MFVFKEASSRICFQLRSTLNTIAENSAVALEQLSLSLLISSAGCQCLTTTGKLKSKRQFLVPVPYAVDHESRFPIKGIPTICASKEPSALPPSIRSTVLRQFECPARLTLRTSDKVHHGISTFESHTWALLHSLPNFTAMLPDNSRGVARSESRF